MRPYALKKPALNFAHEHIANEMWLASAPGSVRVRPIGEREPSASNPYQ